MDDTKKDGWDFEVDGVHNDTINRIGEIKRAIQQLEGLEKEIISYNQLNDVTFAISEKAVTGLRKNITGMLGQYIELLQHNESCGAAQPHKVESICLAEGAGATGQQYYPAYKKSIDVEKIYKLHQQGLSLRAIAKEVGCSPDTVKRRLEGK